MLERGVADERAERDRRDPHRRGAGLHPQVIEHRFEQRLGRRQRLAHPRRGTIALGRLVRAAGVFEIKAGGVQRLLEIVRRRLDEARLGIALGRDHAQCIGERSTRLFRARALSGGGHHRGAQETAERQHRRTERDQDDAQFDRVRSALDQQEADQRADYHHDRRQCHLRGFGGAKQLHAEVPEVEHQRSSARVQNALVQRARLPRRRARRGAGRPRPPRPS